MYQGLVDIDGFNSLDNLGKEAVRAMSEFRWVEASELFDATFLEIDRLTYGVDMFYIINPVPPRYTNLQGQSKSIGLHKLVRNIK